MSPKSKSDYSGVSHTRANKEYEKALKAQLYQLGQPSFVTMLCIIAQLPFAATEEILALSKALTGDNLPLNRAQIYLGKALHWGWLNFANRYYHPQEASGLSPVATSGLSGLFYHPNLLLEAEVEKEYFESLTGRQTATFKDVTLRARHFYLTPKGARVLAVLAGFYRRASQTNCEFNAVPSWQNEFISLFGFRESEVLPLLTRLEGLQLARRFLVTLVNTASRASDATNTPAQFTWQSFGTLGQKFYSDHLSNTSILNLFDGAIEIGNTKILVLADTEQLPPSWIMSYLKHLYSQLQDAVALKTMLTITTGFYCHLDSTQAENLIAALAHEKDSLTQLASQKVTFVGTEVKVVVLTRSRPRAILWREASTRIPIPIELEQTLATYSFEFEAITTNELEQTASAIIEKTAGTKARSLVENGISPPDLKCMVAWASYYLRKLSTNSNPASPTSFRADHTTNLGLKSFESFSEPLGPEENFKFENKSLLELLQQPSKRRLLFTLHSYGMLDTLACARLSGIEMTHLGLHLAQLHQAGLIGRLWGEDVRPGRTWSHFGIGSENEDNSFEASGNKTRLTFCTLPANQSQQSLAAGIEPPRPQSDSYYQDYGQLSKLVRSGTTEYPFACETDRLKRYYYFVTQKGLTVLLWLEGFPISFEPRYRGELTRLARILREVEVGERTLVTIKSSFEQGAKNPMWLKERNLANNEPSGAQIKDWIGFSWPSLLVEHNSGAVNFFLSFGSRHFSLPFQTTPAIYPQTKSTKRGKLTSDKTEQRVASLQWRQPLFENFSLITLESWQTEPLCHRYYLSPQHLANLSYDLPYSNSPDLQTLHSHWGGEKGECLPDGYGELSIERPDGVYDRAILYLEFERGQRNWSERYRAKLASYLRMLWSEWLVQSIKLRQPVFQLCATPRYLLLITPDAWQEHKLVEVFRVSMQEVLAELLREAHYRGYGPGGISTASKGGQFVIRALLEGLNVRPLLTNEELLASCGVLASIWQRL